MAAVLTTTLSLLQPSSQISSDHLHRNNSNNRFSFPPHNTVYNTVVSLSSVPQSTTPLRLTSGGGGGGGGRCGYSRGGGGGGDWDDGERMGPWDSFKEGLRLGFATPERSHSSSFGPSDIIANLVFCWVIERNTGWFSGLFKPKEISNVDMGATRTTTTT